MSPNEHTDVFDVGTPLKRDHQLGFVHWTYCKLNCIQMSLLHLHKNYTFLDQPCYTIEINTDRALSCKCV